MQGKETHGRNGAQYPADVPQQVGVVVVKDNAGQPGSDGGRDHPGHAEHSHVATAHLFRSKVSGDRLAGGNHQHFANGDHNNGRHEHPVLPHKAKHTEPDHIEKCAQRHDLQKAVFS